MKSRGFTLVELLGVIVVLSILALVTIPIISNVVNNMRIKSLENSAYGLIEASNLYYAQNGSNNIRFDINNNKVSSKDTDNLLSYKGSIKNGTVILDKKGNVTICITDGKNSAYKNYSETKVTTSKGKICNIKENSNIVYLDDEATIDSYDNTKLTELVSELSIRMSELEEENNNYLNNIYPVGSIYMSTIDNTVAKVEERFGGTWEVFAEGETLVGYKASDSDYVINKEGGNKTILLTSSQIPTLSVSGNTVATTASNAALEAGNHYHDKTYLNGDSRYEVRIGWPGGTGTSTTSLKHNSFANVNSDFKLSSSWAGDHTHNVSIPALTVEASYRNDTQTNVDIRNPYITVYMYKRIS